MPQSDRYAPNGRQAIALNRVTEATADKDATEAAAKAAYAAWIERMFSASYQGTAHAHVARAAGIGTEWYRQLRQQNRYDDYCAKRDQGKHAA